MPFIKIAFKMKIKFCPIFLEIRTSVKCPLKTAVEACAEAHDL